MKVIIPAAGIGTRLKPHTFSLPKALLSVAGKTIIDHIIKKLDNIDVEEVIFIIGYKGDLIKNHIREKYPNLNASFVYQNEMLGLGHAIFLAKDKIEKDDELLILLGDTLFNIDENFIKKEYDGVLLVKEVDDPYRFGIIEYNNEKVITSLIEKPTNPPTKMAIIGVYYIKDGLSLMKSLETIIVNNIRTKNEFQLTDALSILIKENRQKFSYSVVDSWFDCGTNDTLLDTNRKLLSIDCKKLNERKIEKSITIVEPVSIGENCIIENSIIGPYVSVENNSIIKNSIISNSIIYEKANIENQVLNNSIIGSNSKVIKEHIKLIIGDSVDIQI
jgi:glucose-1-phosphate thymidylyltransferase